MLDYQFPYETVPQRYRDLAERMRSYLAGVGEPQVNRYRPAELRDAVLGAGFAAVEQPALEEIRSRYFAPLASPIPMAERFGLAVARR